MSERWLRYFANIENTHKSILEIASEAWCFSNPFYLKIKRLIKPPAKILEVGCGLGVHNIYLQACGYQVLGIDNDPDIIEKARKNAVLFNSKAAFEVGDAFNLSRYENSFDLVFSVGVIEHFEKSESIELLKNQLKCAKYVIAVVPTKYIKYLDEGIIDEKIYNIHQLKRMFDEAGLKTIDKFGYGDIPAVLHRSIRWALPFFCYKILQKYFSYSMGICCVGVKK